MYSYLKKMTEKDEIRFTDRKQVDECCVNTGQDLNDFNVTQNLIKTEIALIDTWHMEGGTRT